MSGDDDDKPTVVLDLNAIKKQKQKQEEELANIAQDLEFSVGTTEAPESHAPKVNAPLEIAKPVIEPLAIDSETFAEKFLEDRANKPEPKLIEKKQIRVVLFDFNSDFFQIGRDQFPRGYDYHLATTLEELNKFLMSKKLQVIIFNYDVNAKAVNQLTAQIKRKFPLTKTMIFAKSISAEKAKLHAETPSGADGYYKLPLDANRIEAEFIKIREKLKKVA